MPRHQVRQSASGQRRDKPSGLVPLLTCPSGVNLSTKCAGLSVTQMLSELSIFNPCGRVNRPSPMVRRQFPVVIEFHKRMRTPLEDENVTLRVHSYCRYLRKVQIGRELQEAGNEPVVQ